MLSNITSKDYITAKRGAEDKAAGRRVCHKPVFWQNAKKERTKSPWI